MTVNRERFICFLAFTKDACAGIVGLCVPLLADRLGATYDDLGFIGAAGAFSYAACCLVSGRIADRLGYRRTLIAASLMMALVYVAYLSVERVLHLGLLAAAAGLVLAFYWPTAQAWLGQGADRHRLLRALGMFNVSWSFGIFVGPAVAGRLFSADWRYPFALAAAGCALILLGLLLARVRRSELPLSAPAVAAASRHDSRYLPVAWVANFCTFYTVGTVRALFPKYASDLGLSAGLLGDLFALIGVAQVTSFFLITRTDRWQFRLWPLATAQMLGIVGLLLLAFGRHPIPFAVGLVCQGLVIGVTFTSSIFYSLYGRKPAGRRTGIHESIIGSGFLIGPLAGGLIADHVGPSAPYTSAAGVVILGLLLQIVILKRIPRPAGPGASP